MKEEYKKCVDQIHAPKDLIDQTKLAVQKEEQSRQNVREIINDKKDNNRGYYFKWKEVMVAASICVIIIAGGLGYYQVNNHLVMNRVSFSQDSLFETELNLGKADQNQREEGETGKAADIQTTKLEEKNEILEILFTMKPSKINGIKVYVGDDEETKTFYAGIQKDKVFYLITGKQIEKNEFIKYLKENLKNL